MPTLLVEPPSRPLPPEPPRKRWTRAELAVLEGTGVLDQEHLELVDGDLINKMGKKRPHVNSLSLIYPCLIEVFGKQFINLNAPIDVAPEDNPTNEPEPDVIVLKRDLSNFRKANPRPEDLHLVVEVADTTLNFDLTTKAAMYARTGITEYWVLDVSGRRLIVHRNPIAGKYTSIAAWGEHESVAPLAAPDAKFRVVSAFD